MDEKFAIMQFNGEDVEINAQQAQGIAEMLLKTGKFIRVGTEILNISEIKKISKLKFSPEKQNQIARENMKNYKSIMPDD